MHRVGTSSRSGACWASAVVCLTITLWLLIAQHVRVPTKGKQKWSDANQWLSYFVWAVMLLSVWQVLRPCLADDGDMRCHRSARDIERAAGTPQLAALRTRRGELVARCAELQRTVAVLERL